MSNAININSLTTGEMALVRGKVQFSHVTSQYTGQALAYRIEQQRKNGSRFPTTVPHTTISLSEPQIIPATNGVMTPTEQFIQNRFYMNKHNVLSFNIDGKGRYLPVIAQRNTDGSCTQIDNPPAELANGLYVTLVLQVFDTDQNKGIGLNYVIAEEPIRYYTAANEAALKAVGINFTNPVRMKSADDVDSDPDTQPATYPPQTQPAQSPMPMYPAPAPAPAAPAVPGNFAMPTPVQPANPNQAYPQPKPAFPQNRPPQPPIPGAQPPRGADNAPTPGGLRYDPNDDPNRQY